MKSSGVDEDINQIMSLVLLKPSFFKIVHTPCVTYLIVESELEVI